MKVRTGFVSNSSSCSFIVNKHYITGEQLDKIYCHDEIAGDDAWSVDDLYNAVRLSTIMDNFDMEQYLEDIGVPKKAIQYEW